VNVPENKAMAGRALRRQSPKVGGPVHEMRSPGSVRVLPSNGLPYRDTRYLHV